MKSINTIKSIKPYLFVVVLSACSATPEIKPLAPAESPMPSRDVIAEVRALALNENEGIDVQPLGDPVVADLREQAARHEAAGEWQKAAVALEQALMLDPGNPDILQWQAELALAQGQFDKAVELANASWEIGPRLGSLCRRNWAAIRLARELTHYPDAAQVAATQMSRCTVEPPVRM